MDDRVTRVAWLNRSTILYAGNDKWSIDNRVVILSNTKTQYSIKIHNVDIYDEGPYTCSVQTDNHPKTSRVHLIVQGRRQRAPCCCRTDLPMWKDVWAREGSGSLWRWRCRNETDMRHFGVKHKGTGAWTRLCRVREEMDSRHLGLAVW